MSQRRSDLLFVEEIALACDVVLAEHREAGAVSSQRLAHVACAPKMIRHATELEVQVNEQLLAKLQSLCPQGCSELAQLQGFIDGSSETAQRAW